MSLLRHHLPWLAPIAALICIVVLLDRLWAPSPESSDGRIGDGSRRPGRRVDPTDPLGRAFRGRASHDGTRRATRPSTPGTEASEADASGSSDPAADGHSSDEPDPEPATGAPGGPAERPKLIDLAATGPLGWVAWNRGGR